jgi:anti-sigma regulatory factor (Ser/Thr protein kinase)
MEQAQVLSLNRNPAEVARARRYVAQHCADMPSDVRSIAQLLTSEVVTNALEHGAGDIWLRLCKAESALRVEVTDASGAEPRPQQATPDSLRGRGLMILESLASTWGVAPAEPTGKTVWFTLRTR